MIELTKTEFEKYVPLNGMILIEVEGVAYSELNGLLTSNSGSDAVARHGQKRGIVVKVPNKSVSSGYTYYQDIHVKEGDRVQFDYKIALRINEFIKDYGGDDGRYIVCEGKEYFAVPYPQIYVRDRDGELTGLNGMVIGSRVRSKDFLKDEYLPDCLKVEIDTIAAIRKYPQYNPKKGEVVYYKGIILPLEPDSVNPDSLYMLNPERIFATDGVV